MYFLKTLKNKLNCKRRKGFTLIEIMVACAIIIALVLSSFTLRHSNPVRWLR